MPIELIKCNRDGQDIKYTWKGSGHDVSTGMFKRHFRRLLTAKTVVRWRTA